MKIHTVMVYSKNGWSSSDGDGNLNNYDDDDDGDDDKTSSSSACRRDKLTVLG